MPENVNSSETGSDVIIILTPSYPVMLGTFGFVSKRCIQKYRFIGLYFFVFELSPFTYTGSDIFIT